MAQQKNRLLVGINYPWIDYGWDFGNPPQSWVNWQHLPAWRQAKRQRIVEDFTRFADQGLFAIRWFILPDGLNYGIGNEAPEFADGQWRFDCLPEQHPCHIQLLDDFEFVLETCVKSGLQFVPSLIDFHWCHHGMVADPNAGIVKGGRSEIITDPTKRKAFFASVLEPLLEVSLRHPHAIYAWELINEPEWVTTDQPLHKHKHEENKTVPQRLMLDFIREGIGRINSRKLSNGQQAFRSTVGFAHYDTLFDWDSAKLGITLHQFHFYAQKDGKLPPHIFSNDYPCFIGEFATAVQKDWADLKNRRLDQSVINRLNLIEEKGYPAAFLWSAQAVDVATKWTPNEIQDTVAYIRASRGGIGDDVA